MKADQSKTTEPAWDDEARVYYRGKHSWAPVEGWNDNPHAIDCPSWGGSRYEPDPGVCGETPCACRAERRKRGVK